MVSVIVPVFNKHRYLEKALRSVLSQTYGEMEIIVVDDLSTDNSLALAQHLLEDFPNKQVIHNKENKGLLLSRYIGIDAAHGKYIAFMDADDWMEPRAVEEMVNLMTRTGADLVQLRNQRRMRGVGVRYQERYDPDMSGRLIDGDDFRILASYVGMDSYIYPACWGKLYRRDLLKEAPRMDFNQFWGEDQIFNIQYLRLCRSIAFSDFVGYNYRWGGQTTRDYSFSAIRDYKNVHSLKRLFGQSEEDINREMQMLLRYHVRSLFTELGYTHEAVEMVITEELRDPLYARIGLDVDAATLVDQENAQIQKSSLKYVAKRFLR